MSKSVIRKYRSGKQLTKRNKFNPVTTGDDLIDILHGKSITPTGSSQCAAALVVMQAWQRVQRSANKEASIAQGGKLCVVLLETLPRSSCLLEIN